MIRTYINLTKTVERIFYTRCPDVHSANKNAKLIIIPYFIKKRNEKSPARVSSFNPPDNSAPPSCSYVAYFLTHPKLFHYIQRSTNLYFKKNKTGETGKQGFYNICSMNNRFRKPRQKFSRMVAPLKNASGAL